MNKLGEENNIIFSTFVFLFLVIAFLVMMLAFVSSKANSASVWGDFTAKEISRIINYAKPGDEITLNVHKSAAIAFKKKISESEIFTFDNLKKEVCVNLDKSTKYCYGYFNDVDITDIKISWGDPINKLSFKVRNSAK